MQNSPRVLGAEVSVGGRRLERPPAWSPEEVVQAGDLVDRVKKAPLGLFVARIVGQELQVAATAARASRGLVHLDIGESLDVEVLMLGLGIYTIRAQGLVAVGLGQQVHVEDRM